MCSCPVLFILDIKPTIKTHKLNNNQFNLDIYKSIRILNNICNNSIEIYYNTNKKNDIELLLNLLNDDRTVHIFYRNYNNESYTYIGDLSEISLLEYNNVTSDYKYFNMLIDKVYNHKIPKLSTCYKNDIIKYLKYNLSNNELELLKKETLIDLNDIIFKRK